MYCRATVHSDSVPRNIFLWHFSASFKTFIWNLKARYGLGVMKTKRYTKEQFEFLMGDVGDKSNLSVFEKESLSFKN